MITEVDWTALAQSGGDSGEEFDWFGLDRSGLIGVFSTAGKGPIPTSIWAHRLEYLALVDACERLSSNQAIEKILVGAGSYSDWWSYAHRGLFAFDYRDVHRTEKRHTYDLIARPKISTLARNLLVGTDLSWLPRIDVNFSASDAVPDDAINEIPKKVRTN